MVDDEERTVWTQKKGAPIDTPRRYKAIMKQVVGVPFTGILSANIGDIHQQEIIKLLVAGSKQTLDNPGLPHNERCLPLKRILQPVIQRLKSLIGPRLKIYLASIVNKLLDRTVRLRWSMTENNCQTFCDSLIDASLFGPLTSSEGSPGERLSHPLYLMSFVCPQTGYLKNRVQTKYDVPHGLTEEYLLKFHFGRHDEADIIDNLQEYWYDWGAFGSHLYENQDLFPWDCSEAYEKYPTKCNDCNLAKHIWAFPFDSWSMAELHLNRDSNMYPDTDAKWMENRLKVLSACLILARAASGMAKSQSFRAVTDWLSAKPSSPWTDDPASVRVKLGGIHRAQPFSHYFEAGTYSHYFLADWAIRKRPQQIKEYEALRDKRMERKEFIGGGDGLFTANDIDVVDVFAQQFLGFYGMDLLYSDSSSDSQSDDNSDFYDTHSDGRNDDISAGVSAQGGDHIDHTTGPVKSVHPTDEHHQVSSEDREISDPTKSQPSDRKQPAGDHSHSSDSRDSRENSEIHNSHSTHSGIPSSTHRNNDQADTIPTTDSNNKKPSGSTSGLEDIPETSSRISYARDIHSKQDSDHGRGSSKETPSNHSKHDSHSRDDWLSSINVGASTSPSVSYPSYSSGYGSSSTDYGSSSTGYGSSSMGYGSSSTGYGGGSSSRGGGNSYD